MKFDPASKARQSAAMRLMQRVELITSAALVAEVVEPWDRPTRTAERQLIDELEALRVAEKGVMKRCADGYFRARHNSSDAAAHHTTIQRLIDKGLMAWGNSCRSFVTLTEGGRCVPTEADKPWERGPIRKPRLAKKEAI